ncbi:hypothetical protein PsYK624_026350 [Phanerochaete sordida]|uniref:Uncharacterized protein n=1 Tax=Phanerochaete sordida TaxID=48140 RepID=A0A9P3G277_9APHY|nr:hypothetical protein PsYK624_026350 [Phanerochaete sordida]
MPPPSSIIVSSSLLAIPATINRGHGALSSKRGAADGGPSLVLNDWDMAVYKENLEGRGMSGTWPFMSVVALQHPTKPAEVADDLESFIYVILRLAFRFHQHRGSPLVPACATQAEQEEANRNNRYLSGHIDYIFWEEVTLRNGVVTGGDRKHMHILLAEPPITLTKNTPIAIFLNEAYSALREHYQAIDFTKLQPYAARQPSPEPEHGKASSRERSGAQLNCNTHIPWPVELSLPSRTPELSVLSAPPHASSDSDDPDPQRLLDDHIALLVIIRDVLRELEAGIINDDDYLFDQFSKLGRFEDTTPNNSTSSDASRLDLKRSAAEANEDGVVEQKNADLPASARPAKKLRAK